MAAPFQFSLRKLLLAIACIAVALCALQCGLGWLFRPRVSDWEVEEFLRNSLNVGTAKREVEGWLAGRYQDHHTFRDEHGRTVIECWISDSGLPMAPIPDDIRIQFIFDKDEQLESWTVKTEPRF